MSEIYLLNACRLDWEANLFDFYEESIAFRIKILISVTFFNNQRQPSVKLNITITVNVAVFLGTAFFYRTPLVAASELESNISKPNLNKNKKKLFLYFDNCHPNQPNTTKKIWFFSCIVNNNENLKKTDAKKCCFKRV